MALKPDRSANNDYDVSKFMYVTGDRGNGLVAVTGTDGHYGRGAAMDDTNSRVAIAANPSGSRFAGLLLDDVVNLDLSRTHINPYKAGETQIGNKVSVLTRGWVVTNRVGAGQASGIAFPATAYLGTNGAFYTSAGYANSGWPVAGKFLGEVDTEGYAKLYIDINS